MPSRARNRIIKTPARDYDGKPSLDLNGDPVYMGDILIRKGKSERRGWLYRVDKSTRTKGACALTRVYRDGSAKGCEGHWANHITEQCIPYTGEHNAE